jgi:three-Cys-motif partner protein
MSKSTANFFDHKKSWSRIKDGIVGPYLKPFCRKVSLLKQPIILVDAFAGPGIFKDPETGNQEDGSPFMMVEAAKLATVPTKCIFGNLETDHHSQLVAELQKRSVSSALAQAVPLQSRDLLGELARKVTSQSLLIYMDPFGFKGCEFDNLKPFVARDRRWCTEIIVNLDVADLHRLAARDALVLTPAILKNRQTLSAVLNGDWWQPILLSQSLTKDEMERRIVQGYANQYAPYFKYRAFCPVPERAGGQVKYYITTFANHQDALHLHNENMFKAYHTFVANDTWKRGMFDDSAIPLGWHNVVTPDVFILDRLIYEAVYHAVKAGESTARKDVWVRILNEPGNFMKWLHTHYISRVDELRNRGRLGPSTRTSRRINDECPLFIPAEGVEHMQPRQLTLDGIA